MASKDSAEGNNFPTPQTPSGFTPKEAAHIVGITGKALRRAIRKGSLEANKVSGRWYISPRTLTKYLASRKAKAEVEEEAKAES